MDGQNSTLANSRVQTRGGRGGRSRGIGSRGRGSRGRGSGTNIAHNYFASGLPRSPDPILIPMPNIPSISTITMINQQRTNDICEKAAHRAEQRGGSLLQLHTNALPIWICHNSHRFSLPAEAIISGSWCEQCTESLGERATRLYLERLGLDYRCEAKFPSLVAKELLRFDFYIPKLRWLIEIDGEQHFGGASFKGSLLDRLVHDQTKDDWVIRESFSLLRIPYWQLGEIEQRISIVYQQLIANPGPVYVCEYAMWRKCAIEKLKQHKRAPKAPVPADARERTLEARQARREEFENDVVVATDQQTMPASIVITLA